MRLDIRIPVGLLFVVVGAVLTAFGVMSDKALYNRSLDINVNLWWGGVLLIFGVVMFGLGRRSHRAAADTGASTSVPARKGASEQQ